LAQYSDDFRDDEMVYDLILTNIVHQNALVDLLVSKGIITRQELRNALKENGMDVEDEKIFPKKPGIFQ
jgi:arginine repressor